MGAATIKLGEFSEFLDSQGFKNEVHGDRNIVLHAVNTLEDAGPGEISFLTNPKYVHLVATTKASAVIMRRDAEVPNGVATLRCDDPYAAVTAAIERIHGHRSHPRWEIDERAIIAADVRIGKNASVGPHVLIRDNVVIGDNVTLYPGCYIAERVILGDDVTLFPNVVVYDDSRIGNRVTIHANTVIGEDGLGYAPVDGKWLKIPQVGHIVIEDDVDIGACCTLDRATLGTTRIGRGTKMSNLVVVAHGAKIGDDCMIVAQVGIAGSTTLGKHVTLAGQAGVGGHLVIGDNANIGARCGVIKDMKAGGDYLGFPAVERATFHRQKALVRNLPKMKQRLRELEQQVEELKKRL